MYNPAEQYERIFDLLLHSNLKLKPESIERVLFIYDDDVFFLGDNCMILYKLGLCKHFFGDHASVDINFLRGEYLEKYEGICKNNLNFSGLISQKLKHIPYDTYDVVICISLDERPLLEALHDAYPHTDTDGRCPAVFSLSKAVFSRKKNMKPPVFPLFEALYRYTESLKDRPYELYISPAEKDWGNRWLEARGLKKDDELFIIVDNASHRKKLLRLDVYYKFLLHLLRREKARILIFDETGMGKEMFYKEWLGDQYFHRLIFSNKLTLREDLCLVSSDYTRLIFGPCTGMLHCASGIYNHFRRMGIRASGLPALIVYTGPWDADFWWSASPLVHCLVLRNVMGQKKMTALSELSQAEKRYLEDRFDCDAYTSEMLTGYIDSRLAGQGREHDRPYQAEINGPISG